MEFATGGHARAVSRGVGGFRTQSPSTERRRSAGAIRRPGLVAGLAGEQAGARTADPASGCRFGLEADGGAAEKQGWSLEVATAACTGRQAWQGEQGCAQHRCQSLRKASSQAGRPVQPTHPDPIRLDSTRMILDEILSLTSSHLHCPLNLFALLLTWFSSLQLALLPWYDRKPPRPILPPTFTRSSPRGSAFVVRQKNPTTRRLATAPEVADEIAFSSRTTFCRIFHFSRIWASKYCGGAGLD